MTVPFHVFLTRFNLPSRGNESLVRAREGWLRNRVGLFERYCLPSMAAQTSRAFRWIIYFDPESPPWLMQWLQEKARDGAFTPIFRAEVSRSEMLEDIAGLTAQIPQVPLTTNLDNDDALAVDFVERLQAIAPPAVRTAVYLARGIVRTDTGAYLRTDRSNAFCSVWEPWDGAVTCWAAHHDKLGQTMPTLALDGPPGWLQVVHGTNVSNRARGRLVSPRRYGPLFAGLMDDIAEPSRGDMARELLVNAPRRVLREAGRAGAKRVVYALWGTEGADRVKETWTRLRFGSARR